MKGEGSSGMGMGAEFGFGGGESIFSHLFGGDGFGGCEWILHVI